MENKKQLPTKHRTRATNTQQIGEIEALQREITSREHRRVTYLEAKHEYFESAVEKEKKEDPAPEPKEVPKKKRLTIEETKLGVTMVLNKEDCKHLGLNLKGPTREAIIAVRNRLGLPKKK